MPDAGVRLPVQRCAPWPTAGLGNARRERGPELVDGADNEAVNPEALRVRGDPGERRLVHLVRQVEEAGEIAVARSDTGEAPY